MNSNLLLIFLVFVEIYSLCTVASFKIVDEAMLECREVIFSLFHHANLLLESRSTRHGRSEVMGSRGLTQVCTPSSLGCRPDLDSFFHRTTADVVRVLDCGVGVNENDSGRG
jgi:hypothetical protein